MQQTISGINSNDTNIMRCRICLSTSQDDKVSDSPCYLEIFRQLVSENAYKNDTDYKNFWLCMWCKSILKKFLSLRALAEASEKILYSQTQSKISLLDKQVQRHHIPTLTGIAQLHITSTSTNKEDDVLNDDDDLNANNVCEEINHVPTAPLLNEILNEESVVIDYFNEDIGNVNENDMKTKMCEIILKENVTNPLKENKILKSDNNIETKSKSVKVSSKRIKGKVIKHLEKKDEVFSDKNKRYIKLYELKFDVKYLTLEEQLKEIEMKKMKYKDMKFQCDFCGIGFLTSEYLEDHIIRHTKAAGLHKCDICELHFKSPAVLSHHKLSHKRLFVCLICGTVITKWSNCFAHRYKCGASVTYVDCNVCSKIFSDEHSLKVHMRVHNVKKNYVCEHCNRTFATKQRMVVHIRSHTCQKPFVCEHCDKSFTTNSNLKAHYIVHSKETKHYCVECDSHYKTAKSLKRHLYESIRHIRDRPHLFKCNECPKEFSTMKMLNHHSTLHSTIENVRCTQCDKIFSNKSNLRKHARCVHKNVNVTA